MSDTQKSPRRLAREICGEGDDQSFTFEGRRILVNYRPADKTSALSYGGRVISDCVTDQFVELYVSIPMMDERPLRLLRRDLRHDSTWRALTGRDDHPGVWLEGDLTLTFLS